MIRGLREEKGTKLILIGEFGRAHGLKGEVRLKSFAAEPKAIARYGPLHAEDGRQFVLKGVRPAGGGSPDVLIARVDRIATREAAEALNGLRLYVPRQALGDATGRDEFLLADLIGLSARDPQGHALGSVVAVPNYGAGDLLEVATGVGAATVLVPFTERFVPSVEIAAGHVVVDAPDLFSVNTDAA
jgi:16S rRNA processing protein RimM